MSSLTSLLPAPRQQSYAAPLPVTQPVAPKPQASFQPPPYGRRKNFVPRSVEDYGGGGAFPEIHVAQYPLDMGRPNKSSSTAVIPVTVNEKGEVKHDGILHQGANAKKKIYSSFTDIVEKRVKKQDMALPSVEEEEETTARTRMALEKLIEGKVRAARPVQIGDRKASESEPNYVRYTPNPNAPGYNPHAKQRVIRMVEQQVDPMEPPKFKHKKVARGPPSPPVPVLHSPPRKVTVKEQQQWKIPPCVSNWKNAKGYTIPLDKRLAADGRGLQEVTINDNFATLSESLYIAERKAREEVKMRNQIQRKLAMKQKEEEEAKLRDLAARARMERAGMMTGRDDDAEARGGHSEDEEEGRRGRDRRRSHDEDEDSSDRHRRRERDSRRSRRDSDEDEEDRHRSRSSRSRRRSEDEGERRGRESRRDRDEDEEPDTSHMSREERVAMQQREKLRKERKREREREMRLDNLHKKSKISRDKERDISEKIALGQHVGAGAMGQGSEGMFDSRLFNQSQGMSSGFGDEEDYNVYSKPMFDRGEAQSVYRPRSNKDAEMYGGDADSQLDALKKGTDKFRADKGFRGTERGGHYGDGGGAGKRDGPVAFEKQQVESDPFGLDQFLTEAKKGKKAMDSIGKGGTMSASAGSGSRESYEGGSSRR